MSFRIPLKLILSCLLASLGFSACGSEPTLIPFAADKAGNSASQTIHVRRESGWTVHLMFVLPKGLAWNDPRVVRLHKLLTEITGGPSTRLKPHKGMRLLVTVTQKKETEEIQIRNKAITEEEMYTSNQIYVDGFRLSPGEYVVSVEALEDDLRLTGVEIALSVGTKPFTY